jgi:sugar phosphate isomerase/epimerase
VKYSFMSFSTPEMSFAEMLQTAQRFGYDGIEPRTDAGHAHGVEVAADKKQRRAFARQADDAGIAIACVATSLRYADPAMTDDMLKQTRERIDLAGDLGAPTMRVFGGKLGQGLSREAAIDLVAGSLSKVASRAAACGVTLCMETHDDWCNPEHVAAVLSQVNHPAVACNWDIMHPVRTGQATIDESFKTLKLWIRHLHIHDGTGDGIALAPIGEGVIDHKRAIQLLKKIDYDGFLSGEWINWEDAWDVHLPREIATLRRYEEELG